MTLKHAVYCILSKFVLHENGNWKYLKIGKLFIGAYSSTATFAITAQTGPIYQSTVSGEINLPETINNLYTNVAVKTPSYTVWTAITEYGSSRISYRVVSAASRTSATYDVKAFTFGII